MFLAIEMRSHIMAVRPQFSFVHMTDAVDRSGRFQPDETFLVYEPTTTLVSGKLVGLRPLEVAISIREESLGVTM